MWSKTQELQQAHLIKSHHTPDFGGTAQPLQRIGQQAKQGRVAAFLIISKTVKQFQHISSVAGAGQVIAQRQVRIKRFHLGHNRNIAAAGELHRNVGKRLQMSGFMRANLADTLGNRAQLALFARVKCQNAVSFAPIGVTQHHGFSTERTRFIRHQSLSTRVARH